jgi:hypothetical protein
MVLAVASEESYSNLREYYGPAAGVFRLRKYELIGILPI